MQAIDDAMNFEKTGLRVIERFLSPSQCEDLLRAIEDYSKERELPIIYRKESGRSLNYKVIDGDQVHNHLPQLERLYLRVNEIAKRESCLNLAPLENRAASVNVNITPPSGEYRSHYHRNAVTAILYLNEVPGGETEMYPNYRLHLGSKKHTRLQRWLDALLQTGSLLRLFGKKVVVAPRAGMLIIMRGDRCLHSVCPVEGQKDRINLIMTFDLPGAVFAVEENLDPYLYTRKEGPSFDPNYRE